MCFLVSLRNCHLALRSIANNLESDNSYKLTVSFLPNIKQQADTVGKYLVNIFEHLAAKETHLPKVVVETKS